MVESWVSLDFNMDKFFNALTHHPNCLRKVDPGITYFYEYLEHEQCRSMLIENKYVDHEYLEDFSKYYVRCFQDYDRFCKRIHFFKEFSGSSLERRFNKYFDNEIKPKDIQKDLQKRYIGFLVAKPLPSSIIGRAALSPYNGTRMENEDVQGARSIRCVRDYPVNIFGVPLTVRSMAYMEQDKDVGACATSAIWSAFQKTSEIFGHSSPSLYTITSNATEYLAVNRAFPSNGLNTTQMCQALRKEGLDPDYFEIMTEEKGKWSLKHPLLLTTYAYLRAGIPVIMLVEIKGVGRHAVTISGYKVGEDHTVSAESDTIKTIAKTKSVFRSSKIKKFYAHDDRIGPFCRLMVKSDGNYPIFLEGEWKKGDNVLPMIPLEIIIPLYHKIRVPPVKILSFIKKMETLLEYEGNRSDALEWDLYLSSVNDYKTEFSRRTDISTEMKRAILQRSHPRFIWCARAFSGGKEVCEMLSDATDMVTSFPPYLVNIYDDALKARFKKMTTIQMEKYYTMPTLNKMAELVKKCN